MRDAKPVARCVSVLAGIVVATVLAVGSSQAQSSDKDVETVIGLIENSPTNALAREFSSLYFDSGIHVFTKWSSTQSTNEKISASIQENSPALQRYLNASCSDLTSGQKRLLAGYANFRYRSLVRTLSERRADLIRVMGPGALKTEASAELIFADPCANTASSGPAGISISHNLVLAALFSVYFLDAHFLAVPKRAALEWEIITPRIGSLSDASSASSLARIQSMPLFSHHLRALRSMGFGAAIDRDVSPEGLAAERHIPLGRVEAAFFGSQCQPADRTCAVKTRLATLSLSEVKLDLLLKEQVDFMLAHEIGHHVLGHAAAPLEGCAAELEREAAADRIAVSLIRPATGLFEDTPTGPRIPSGLDHTIASGLELFMLQTHRLANLIDGDSCAYPTFGQRLANARAFEQASFARPN